MVTGDHTRVGLNPLLSEVPQPISIKAKFKKPMTRIDKEAITRQSMIQETQVNLMDSPIRPGDSSFPRSPEFDAWPTSLALTLHVRFVAPVFHEDETIVF